VVAKDGKSSIIRAEYKAFPYILLYQVARIAGALSSPSKLRTSLSTLRFQQTCLWYATTTRSLPCRLE